MDVSQEQKNKSRGTEPKEGAIMSVYCAATDLLSTTGNHSALIHAQPLQSSHVWCPDAASRPSYIHHLPSAFPYQSWLPNPEMRSQDFATSLSLEHSVFDIDGKYLQVYVVKVSSAGD